jgi:4-amino-4-deoxychorismate lyase
MTVPTTRLFRGTEPLAALDPADRGFAYGDGLFETMRLEDGGVPWLDAHLARLGRDAGRLRLTMPPDGWLRERIREIGADAPRRSVLKLTLTRGAGGRGYAPPRDATPTLVLAVHPLPPPPPSMLTLRWCATRAGIQPALAGMKHLNRLEQVLARAEWTTENVDEGLMLNNMDEVVGATSANVFALVFGLWITPPVHLHGIAGIMRSWVLANASAREAPLTRTMLEAADAVFLCNAVRGILPVGSLGDRRWAMHPALDAVRRRLHKAEPAFDPGR